ncbi:Alpha-1,3-mannosyl-glycoprotein 4-beta-N-acetylglucosaminyltransferase B, partial [Araneus ventricosus]
KMFKAVDLSKLVTFFTIFHNDKPVDWLLDHMIQTKVCRFDRDSKDCRKQKDNVWIHYRPSLFQHVGTHSSLKGKVQKLTVINSPCLIYIYICIDLNFLSSLN